MNRITRELNKLGGVPKGSPSSAILLATGSKIESNATAVPTMPLRKRTKPAVRAKIFTGCIRLTLTLSGRGEQREPAVR
jgi:hypothetical protein